LSPTSISVLDSDCHYPELHSFPTRRSSDLEMKAIINEYNEYYGTSWSIQDIERYNGDINNRLARKKGEFKQFGNQIDLVIVVDRDRKSTRLNSSHVSISYAVFCLKKKRNKL